MSKRDTTRCNIGIVLALLLVGLVGGMESCPDESFLTYTILMIADLAAIMYIAFGMKSHS